VSKTVSQSNEGVTEPSESNEAELFRKKRKATLWRGGFLA